VKSIYLIDASIYIFRGWFSLPVEIVDRQGNPSNAIVGYARFLTELLERRGVRRVVAMFDEPLEGLNRKRLYPPYKANREAAPEELKRQFNVVRRLSELLGVPTFSHANHEADDLIATGARVAREQGYSVTVVSADKDLAQLIGPQDRLLDWARNRSEGPGQIKERLGVYPEQVIDYLALTGDSVDNVPGVPGVGPKSARVLLKAFNTLDGVYRNLESLEGIGLRSPGRTAKQLKQGKDLAELSKQLVTLKQDIPQVEERLFSQGEGIDHGQLEAVINEYGFGSYLARRMRLLTGAG